MTDFEVHPGRYQHWKLQVDGPVARLLMNVDPELPLRPGYKLKLNSYDLGVDIELADAVQRLRFEHPYVKAVIVSSANPKIFCAGANINMLALSSHPFKVNFCKFTNETRCAIEDATASSGQHYIAAINGTASGGGYELASACAEIYLLDDGNSAVSLPELPLLGVLPGTGGLTRLVDKRKVRRDLADVFSTLAEGVKARRAKEWGLVDGAFPRSRFDQEIDRRAQEIASRPSPKDQARGIVLEPLAPRLSETGGTGVALGGSETGHADDAQHLAPALVGAGRSETTGAGGSTIVEYRYVTLRCDRARRMAELVVTAPERPQPRTVGAIHEAGGEFWPLRAFREIDDAICRLRFDEEEIGLVLIKTRPASTRSGSATKVSPSLATQASPETRPRPTPASSMVAASRAATKQARAPASAGPPTDAAGAADIAGAANIADAPDAADEAGAMDLAASADAAALVLEIEQTLAENRADWLVNEIVLYMARVLRRLDLTAKSLFAIVDGGSCFAGSLLELALAADRIYMKNDPEHPAFVSVGPLSGGQLPMPNGISRLQSRFLARPEHAGHLARERPRLDAAAALEAGLATVAPDELDWDEAIRVATEERLSLSPDALTGMEASLRFGGPETMESKIYGRLSAWQNWIFIRPNATGEHGALRLYGQPERPKFDWRRT